MAVNNNVIDACAYESKVLELDNSVLTTAKSNVAFSRSSDMISIFLFSPQKRCIRRTCVFSPLSISIR